MWDLKNTSHGQISSNINEKDSLELFDSLELH